MNATQCRKEMKEILQEIKSICLKTLETLKDLQPERTEDE